MNVVEGNLLAPFCVLAIDITTTSISTLMALTTDYNSLIILLLLFSATCIGRYIYKIITFLHGIYQLTYNDCMWSLNKPHAIVLSGLLYR